MVILLEFNLDELYSCGTEEQVSCFLEHIASQIRSGAHVFIGAPLLFQGLSEDLKLSLSARKIFSLHRKKMIFLNEYRTYPIKTVIKVKNEPWKTKINNDETEFNLKNSINDDEIFKSIKESSLVFENINDDKIYKRIFTYMQSKRGLNETIKYNPIHGGGNDTYRISREEMNKTYNTFCICDSDLKHRNSPLGQTARQVLDVFSECDKLHHTHIIKVHEIENLIPVQFYNELAKLEQKQSVNAMLAASLDSPEHLFCYDIKDAHKYERVFSNEDDFSNFWKVFYSSPHLKEHVENASQKFKQGEKDVRILPRLSGLCNPVKERFISEKNNDFSVSTRLEQEWNDIFERIKIWCAATKPIAL